MIRYEIQNLLRRRGIVLILLAPFVLNGAMAVREADKLNEDGYSPAQMNAAYKELPEEDGQTLSWIEAKLDDPNLFYDEYLMYLEIQERVSDAVNYQEDLATRLAEADLKLNSPFFAKQGTFDYRSLLSLEKAYGSISKAGIQPSAESSLGIELATETRFTDALLVFIALTLAFGLGVLPKEEGLFALLKPMKNGRKKLLTAKYLTMLSLLFLAAILIYGMNLLIGQALLGLGDLSRPVQSLYGFTTCRYVLSVFQYLVLFMLHKFFWAAALGSLFLCLSVFIRKSIGVFFAALVILLVSILCFQSTQPWISMTNLIWTSDTRWYFSGYYNLSFFGYPVDAFMIALAVQCILLVAACVCAHIRFKREETVAAEKSGYRKGRTRLMHTNLMLHEGYKLFVRQQGALILLVFLVFQIYSCHSQYYNIDIYDRYYPEKLSGPISVAQEEFIAAENAMFDDINAQLAQYSLQLMDGNISEETYEVITRDLQTQLLAEEAFRRAENQYSQLKELAEEGYDARYVELQVYEHIVGDPARTERAVDAAKLTIVIALGLSALFATEHSSHMDQLLTVMPLRRRANRRKIFWAGLFTVIATLTAFVPRIVSVSVKLGYMHLNASIRSLLFLPQVSLALSILGYILVSGIVWMIAACVGAVVTMFISDKNKSRAVAALAACLLLIIPALLLVYIL